MENHKKENPTTIILASGSARRKELLRQMKLPFEALEPEIDETCPELTGLPVEAQVTELAQRKTLAVASRLPEERRYWLAGFDTLVELGGQILGKPADRGQAAKILTILSGNDHYVHTGVALLAAPGSRILSAICTTRVKFKSLNPAELEYYLATNEWQGVAGAYRIQERGAFFIEAIAGSYSNVVGLPISLFYGMLRDCNYPFTL